MSLFFFYTGVCMTSTIDLMCRRRSVAPHLLAEPAPDAAQLEALLTLASRVPDHGKLTPWRFIVIQGGARLRLGDAIAGFAVTDDPSLDAKRIEIERQRLARAPLVIAIVSRSAPHAKIPEWEQMLSSGASCMALTLAANAMGFASAWLTEWYGYDRRFLDVLGLASHERIAGFVHIGTPLEAPVDRPRPLLSDIVTTIDR
jgi:nitroreductase